MFLEIVSPSIKVKNFGLAHSAAANAKEPIVINARVVIPINTSEIGVLNAYVYEAEITRAPKAPSQAWDPLVPIYWDATAEVFTADDDSGGNALVGHALEAVAGGAGDTTSGLIAFNSFAA